MEEYIWLAPVIHPSFSIAKTDQARRHRTLLWACYTPSEAQAIVQAMLSMKMQVS